MLHGMRSNALQWIGFGNRFLGAVQALEIGSSSVHGSLLLSLLLDRFFGETSQWVYFGFVALSHCEMSAILA